MYFKTSKKTSNQMNIDVVKYGNVRFFFTSLCLSMLMYFCADDTNSHVEWRWVLLQTFFQL